MGAHYHCWTLADNERVLWRRAYVFISRSAARKHCSNGDVVLTCSRECVRRDTHLLPHRKRESPRTPKGIDTV